MANGERKPKHAIKLSPNTLRGRKVYALILITMMVLAPALFAGVVQLMGSSGTNTGALQGHESITSMVSQVWGWNGTTWKAATLTLTSASYQVSAAFPAGFAVKSMIVATANSSYDVTHLLESSYIFSTTKVTTAVTSSGSISLNSVYEYLATFTNSSAVSSYGDKAVTGAVLNQTLYGGSTNQLGNPVEYNMIEMFASPAHSVPLYKITFANDKINATQALTVTFVNYLSYPFSFNLVFDQASTVFVLFLISAIITVFYASPRTTHEMSSSEKRAHSYAFRERELPYLLIIALIGVIEVVVFWFMGSAYPGFFGVGGGIAAFSGFVIGVYLYSVAKSIGRFDAATLVGLVTSVLFLIVNIPTLFGPMIYNMWAYETFPGEGAAVTILFALVVLLVESFMVTKRADLV